MVYLMYCPDLIRHKLIPKCRANVFYINRTNVLYVPKTKCPFITMVKISLQTGMRLEKTVPRNRKQTENQISLLRLRNGFGKLARRARVKRTQHSRTM
jgi:hypothetical protein